MINFKAVSEYWLNKATTPLGQARIPCEQCGLNTVCEAITAGEQDAIAGHRSRLGSGQILFRAGDSFKGVYAVTSGAIKTYATLHKDQSQIIDFHFPGDAVGLEAVERGTYTYTACALTESLICRIDLDSDAQKESTLADRYSTFQREIIRAMAEQLQHEQSLSILLRVQTAEQRVVTFLLSLAGPSVWMDAQQVELRLPMPRKDIANYLGIAVETLCRLLKHLQDNRLIDSHGRSIRLLDVARLDALVRTTAPQSPEVS